jgi:tetratricopeptide (TPR) repeat protein
MSLNNLATALRTRFHQSGQRNDLDDAILFHGEALDELASGHPSFCSSSVNLGLTLMDGYSHADKSEYLEKGIAAFRMAAMYNAAAASIRFQAAKLWAHFADYFRHESALDAYQAAIELLPRLAMLGLDLQSRKQALTSGSDGLARNAATCAIRSSQYGRAVELLEAGRGVFWSQALQLRTPMTDLRGVAPELEKKLMHISLALERGSLRDASRHLSDTPQKVISMEKEASYCYRLNEEWLATLSEVRQIDGFQDFLRPSRLSVLQHAATNGPVILLNASQTDCAALILTSTESHHVLLPDLSLTGVIRLVEILRYAIERSGRDMSLLESSRARVEELVQQMPCLSAPLRVLKVPLERHVGRASDTFRHSEDIFRYVLGVLWESVVEPVLRSLNLQASWIFIPTTSVWSSLLFTEIRLTSKFAMVPHRTIRLSSTPCSRNVPS